MTVLFRGVTFVSDLQLATMRQLLEAHRLASSADPASGEANRNLEELDRYIAAIQRGEMPAPPVLRYGRASVADIRRS